MKVHECDHRETEGYEHKMFEVGPKCRARAKHSYEWGYETVHVCERHASELPDDIELEPVDAVA